MPRIALLTPWLVEADATANDVLGMHSALQRRGHEVRLFADWSRVPTAQVDPPGRLAGFLRDPDAVLIYHHSTGWAPGCQLVRQARCRRVLKYHNVTPWHFFQGIHGAFVQACQAGREQMGRLARIGCQRYLADSAYNLGELIEQGSSPEAGAVVPPFHQVDRLHGVQPDADVLRAYQDGRTNVLMVGRIAPNKGHAQLIDAFAVYHHEYNRHSRLLIVGKADERTTSFQQGLLDRVIQHELGEAVVFTGPASDQQLRACYQVADVFAITSAHEGFCVPLVEAMAMRVPVVALGSTAVPETLGEAGLVWETPDPYLLAESIHQICTTSQTRSALAAAGWQRYQEHFSNTCIEARFLRALEGIL
jgi:glycosyltransferase involved in cell wall biosynthesis